VQDIKQEVEQIKNTPRPKIVAPSDELARAHQDVIAQMREALLEARGGRSTLEEGVVVSDGDKEREQSKPPVPPTKAAAVAKIREAIAEARREAQQDQGR